MEDYKEERQDGMQNRSSCQPKDINDQIILDIRDTYRIMHSLYEGKSSQRRILIILNEMQSITQRELTKILRIQPGSASEVVAKLEHAGLVTKKPSETDRRTMVITLTEEGRRLAVEATEQRNIRHQEMFSCLSDDEKNTLLTLLEKIHSDWKDRYQNTDGQQESCRHKISHYEREKSHLQEKENV